MKPRRPLTAILLLFLILLAAWLIFRPHPSTSSTNDPTAIQGPAQLPASQIPAVPSAVPTGPANLAATTPVPPFASPPAVAMTAKPATPFDLFTPLPATNTDPASQKNARSESASINAIRVRRMVTDYHTLTGENPVGTNAEIMAAVMGKNPRHATLGPPEGFELNAQGELIDDWGTPYFFHQLSRDVMEIHSAGPDKTMGTADDIVVR